MEANEPTLRAEELLADARWIRGIARSLIADSATADDVVQDAWVAALAHDLPAADQRGSRRPWLVRVVRNLAANHWRSSARRADREAACASKDVVASTADLVARAETQRLVVGAVLALDEPYRTAILLAHVEGLTSVEIARSLGVSESTVRWRIARGLSLLRYELERRRGREWLASCVLFLLPADRAAALASAQLAGACAGVPAMSKTAVAGVLVLLFSGGAAVALREGVTGGSGTQALARGTEPDSPDRDDSTAWTGARHREVPVSERVSLLDQPSVEPPLFDLAPGNDVGQTTVGESVRNTLKVALGDGGCADEVTNMLFTEVDQALSAFGLSLDKLDGGFGSGIAVALDVTRTESPPCPPPEPRVAVSVSTVVQR